MEYTDRTYKAYIHILKNELLPAVGCTEPSAIAYTAARARELLGNIPDRVIASISGDIIKNAKSAVVPNTNGGRGIQTAIAAGIIAGDSSRQLQVLSHISEKDREKIKEYMEKNTIEVRPSVRGCVFEIDLEVFWGKETVRVRMEEDHTNIVFEEKNGVVNRDIKKKQERKEEELYALLNVGDIVRFTDFVRIQEIRNMICTQIDCNMRIAEEGLRTDCGANIGRTILALYGDRDVRIRAKAKAAAGSDARMSGSPLPVIVVSGSGNQGITASVPVVEYARSQKVSDEMCIRAVALSDLIAIYLKHGIGKLSAFCGALCAGIGAACGIAYLNEGKEKEIAHTIVNTLGILSGMICDGAKASCAAKIAASVDSAIFGYEMFKNGQEFVCGDGIVSYSADRTVENIARLGSQGLKQADHEILQMMMQSERRG